MGLRQPRLPCSRCKSYQPSIHSEIAVRAMDLLGQGRSPNSSFFKVAKNDSTSASSQHRPVRPTDSRISNSTARRVNSRLVYCWKTEDAFPALLVHGAGTDR